MNNKPKLQLIKSTCDSVAEQIAQAILRYRKVKKEKKENKDKECAK